MDFFYLSIDLALNKTGIVLLLNNKILHLKLIKNKKSNQFIKKLFYLEKQLSDFVYLNLSKSDKLIILIEKPYISCF